VYGRYGRGPARNTDIGDLIDSGSSGSAKEGDVLVSKMVKTANSSRTFFPSNIFSPLEGNMQPNCQDRAQTDDWEVIEYMNA